MENQRNIINQLIIEADRLISQEQFDDGLKKFREAKELARNIKWDSRIDQIDQMITASIEKREKKNQLSIKQQEIKKIKQDELEFEKKIIEKDQREQNKLERKKQHHLEEISKKKQEEEKISQAVFDEIEKVENKIKIYKKNVKQGKILEFECPYLHAEKVYRQAAKDLTEIGWNSEAKRILEGAELYLKEFQKDKRLREFEEKKHKKKNEADFIAQPDSIKITSPDVFGFKEKSKKNKISEKDQQAENIAKGVFDQIEEIEKRVKIFEENINKLSIESIYPEVINAYLIGAKKLGDIGWNLEANRLREGVEAYRHKSEVLEKNRKIFQMKQAEEQKQKNLLHYKELEAKRIEEEKKRKEIELIERTKREKQEQEQQIQQIFIEIEEIEKKIKIYENQVDKLNYECPYNRAIEIYKNSTQKFAKIGMIDQSNKIKDGISFYENKLEQDKKYRALELQKIEKSKEEQEKLQKRAKFTQLLEKEKEEEARAKLKQEFQEKEKKQAIADHIYKKITDIEEKVKIYEDKVEKTDIVCPYEEAIRVYSESATELSQIGWIDQSAKLLEGVNAYKEKLIEDQKLRESAKKRSLIAEEEKRALEKQAFLAQKQKEEQKRLLDEKIRKEQEEKNYKQSIADRVFSDIDKIEEEIKDYESHIDPIPYLSPYPKAVKIYTESANRLKEIDWNEEANRLLEGARAYQEKEKMDRAFREEEKLRVAKTKEEEQVLERRAKLSQKLKEERLKEEQQKKQSELEEKKYKQSIADQIFANIELMEQKAKEYESQVNRIVFPAPYQEIIDVYAESAKRLTEIGWQEQSLKLFEGVKTYQAKLQKDIEYRQKEKEKIARSMDEEKELKRIADEALKQKEEFQRIQNEKKKKEKEEKLYQQSIADQVFAEIDQIEDKIKDYESHVDKVPYISPYSEAVSVYTQAANTLKEIGWVEESIRLYDGAQSYKEKEKRDRAYREEEKLRIAKTKEEEEMLERRAKLAQKLQEERIREAQQKKQNELEEKAYKQSIAGQVFANIELMEQKAKDYESNLDKLIQTPPYKEIIQTYNDSARRLAEIGWKEQSMKLFEGVKAYQNKLIQDQEFRKKEQNKIASSKKAEKLLQEQAIKAEKLRKEQKLAQEEKLKQEREERAYKQSIADQVFAQIDQIEEKIKDYESHVDRIPYIPPYTEAVKIYSEAASTLKKIGWIEESIKFYDGAKAYREKENRDRAYREEEKLRIAKTKEDQEMLNRRAELAKHLREERERELLERKRREEEEKSYKQSIADQVFKEIDDIEKIVKDYESHPDKIPYDCPYDLAIKTYSNAAKKLAEIEWNDESFRLFEGVRSYQEKKRIDTQYRKEEKLKIAKTEEEQELLRKRELMAQRIKEKKEREEREKKQHEIEEKAIKQRIANQILNQIETIEQKVKDYEVHVDKIPFSPPYEEAIKVYSQSAKKLAEIGWNDESLRLFEGLKNYQEKLRKDKEYRVEEKLRVAKTKEEEEMLERRSRLSKRLEEEKKREEEAKKRQVREEKAFKQSIVDQIFEEIDQVAKIINEYENHVDKIPYECPYEMAIKKYTSSANRLAEIGWNEESLRLFEGVRNFQDKLRKDKKYREEEKLRIAKTKEEELMLEKRAEKARKLKEEKELRALEKRKQEHEEKLYKKSIADQVFTQIEEIEEKIRNYENLPDKIPYSAPYSEAIEIYLQSSNTLKEIGWVEESIRLYEGARAYREKEKQDREIKEEEKVKKAKSKEEQDLLDKRAKMAQKLREERLKEKEERERKEREEKKYKQSIADQVFQQIDKVEALVKEYEAYIDKVPYTPPYDQAIEEYTKAAEILREIGWTDQSIKLFEGVKTYREKLQKDKKLREEEKKRIAKTQEEQEMLERRAKLAQKLEEQRIKELQDKKAREQKENAYKMAIADQVFSIIDKIEKKVEEYDTHVDKIPYDCPYKEAAEIYSENAQRLSEIGWNEESIRLFEGAATYNQKYQQDLEFREKEKLRVARTKEEQDLLKRREELAEKIRTQKILEEKEKARKEIEENKYKQSLADKILSEIDQIEKSVKEYEGQPDKIPYKCPYEEAISKYTIGAERLREIGWVEESIRLFDGANTYREKLRRDNIYREEEKLRVAKTQEEQKLLEERALLAEKLKKQRLEAQKLQKEKQEREREERAKIADKIFQNIEQIELEIREYESHIDRIPFECPYEKAQQIYLESAKKLEEIGWVDEGLKLYEGVKTYRDKSETDKNLRLKVKKRMEMQERKSIELQRRIEQSQKLLEDQIIQEEKEKSKEKQKTIEQRNKSNEALNLIAEGNEFANQHEYKNAIVKYLEAGQIFQEIGWMKEAERIYNQINFFKQDEINYQNELHRQEEERLAKIKELEEFERKAQLSWKIEQKKKLEQEKIRKRKEEEKRKQDLEEIQNLIKKSKKLKEFEERKILEEKKKEEQKSKEIQQIQYECLILLDKARNNVDETKYQEALKIYDQVLQLYLEIDYTTGIRITKETIAKTQSDYEAYQEQLRLKKEAEKQREQEILRLNEMIQKSHEESERLKLEEQKRKLEQNEIKTREEQIQNQIVDLLELGSNHSLQHEYDLALDDYSKALELFEEIHWPLKKKQIEQLVEETHQKKEMYLLQIETFRKRQQEEELERNNFEKQMAIQDEKRKETLSSFEEFTQEQRKLAMLEKSRGDEAYEFLGQAEAALEENHPYLTLYYLHHAMHNFESNKWALEANTTKKRLRQVSENFSENLIFVPEMVKNTNFEIEKTMVESLTRCYDAFETENSEEILLNFDKARNLIESLNWENTLKNLKTLENEIYALNAKIEHRNQLPTKEDGFNLLNMAKKSLEELDFEKAIGITENAEKIFTQLKMNNQARLCQQNIMRYKLMNKKNERERPLSKKIQDLLSPEAKRARRIEKRKQKRRALRKKERKL